MMPLLGVIGIFLIAGCRNNIPVSARIGVPPVKDVAKAASDTSGSKEIAVQAPPFSDGIFPCSECHKDLVPNPKKRVLVEMHDSISAIFNHDKENRWCLDCHDMKNRDYLKLASGSLLDFKESYKLCGQCHGDKLRDWKVGVHGKRTGDWNGKKEYLLCVNCHNPHSPKFKGFKPEPPPVRQEDIR
jgi:hypothetical protein